MNFSSSFIKFIENCLIEDENMKIILTGIRLLSKLMFIKDILEFVMKNA